MLESLDPSIKKMCQHEAQLETERRENQLIDAQKRTREIFGEGIFFSLSFTHLQEFYKFYTYLFFFKMLLPIQRGRKQ